MRMKGENENSFDFQIRSILGDATEEVPEKVWAGIERRLPAVQEDSGNTVVLPLWTKLAAGFAAAATVAAIMFLAGTFDRTAPQGSYDRLAESGTKEEINIVVPEKTEESAGEEAAPGSLEQATEPSVEDKASGITAGEAVRSAATGLLADAQEYRTGDDSLDDSGSTGKEEAGQSGQEDMDKAAGTEENPDSYFPRPRGYTALQGTSRELTAVNDRYLQNIGYCRLKNLTVGYTLPRKWTRKINIDAIRIYFTGENLATWSGIDSDYVDPEMAMTGGDLRIYPWQKTFMFGIDINF